MHDEEHVKSNPLNAGGTSILTHILPDIDPGNHLGVTSVLVRDEVEHVHELNVTNHPHNGVRGLLNV